MGSVSFGGQHPTSFAPGAQVCLTHQPRHPFAREASPVVLQLCMDARTPISASVCDKDLPDLASQLSIFSAASADRTLAPGVESAFGNAKHLAHDHNGKLLLVLFDKLIFHLLSREKTLTTFFKISRSCWTLSSSRLRRRFSSSNGV